MGIASLHPSYELTNSKLKLASLPSQRWHVGRLAHRVRASATR
jgi:hypothetical protein